ncbi:Pro-Pol polyprotein [Dictyocoela muelleri]|nr:Pro-Pol polyprotein [Dictyocoela muelleri]
MADKRRYSDRITTPNGLKVFKERARKFYYCSASSTFKFILGPARHIRFFTIEEVEFKKEFIIFQHESNGHAGQDKHFSLQKTKAYGITRNEVLAVTKSCEICQSRRSLITRTIIRPIVSYNPRERYNADLIDFRYYSEVNDGCKWMLVVVDSFSKYMWTVLLNDKSGPLIFSAIKTIFMINGHSFILHTDNGREFCNVIMRDMLTEFDVRHVKGRARCPWIQRQVERANQTIKWMIGSMLMTLNAPGKWTLVREDANYYYNTMRHSTTSKTSFTLMFGLPINDIIQPEVLASIN